MSNWIQFDYKTDTSLTIFHPDTGADEQVVVVGYSHNDNGRADGVMVQGRDGQTRRVHWLELSWLNYPNR